MESLQHAFEVEFRDDDESLALVIQTTEPAASLINKTLQYKDASYVIRRVNRGQCGAHPDQENWVHAHAEPAWRHIGPSKGTK